MIRHEGKVTWLPLFDSSFGPSFTCQGAETDGKPVFEQAALQCAAVAREGRAAVYHLSEADEQSGVCIAKHMTRWRSIAVWRIFSGS